VSVLLEDRASAPVGIGSWRRAALVLAVSLAIILLATAAGYGAAALFDTWARVDEPRAFAAGEMTALLTARVTLSLVVFQCVTILLVFLANARLRFPDTSFLPFQMPLGGARTLALAVLALLVLAGIYGGLVYSVDKQAFSHDIEPFAEMMKSRTWWLLLLAAGVGAPLAEECLFRGLLYGALRRTPFGMTGAALLTAVMWALLHANYSAYGLVAITLIGLYLAFLRERTGTLVTPIVCHGAYNSLIVLALAFAPENFLSAG
jgi:membrane protease YdiL (CAAX protease family)